MSKAAMNLQDSFLNQVRRENSEVRVLLVNGTLLRGTVKGFDNFTLILNNRNGQHLIYKHAVAQIVTHRTHVRTEDMQHTDSPSTSETQSESSAAMEPQPSPEKASEKHAGGQKQGPSEKQQRGDRGGQGEHRSKPKKEGFNTLDLSGVKLGEGKKE